MYRLVCFVWLTGIVYTSEGQTDSCRAAIVVYAPEMDLKDTLEVRVWPELIGYEYLNPHRLYIASNVDGRYHFDIDSLFSLSRMSLHLRCQRIAGRPSNGILRLYALNPGDSIGMRMERREGFLRPVGGYDDGSPVILRDWACEFAGRGSAKFQARFDWDDRADDEARRRRLHRPAFRSGSGRLESELGHMDSLIERCSAWLESFREDMSEADYGMVFFDLTGSILRDRIKVMREYCLANGKDSLTFDAISDLIRLDVRHLGYISVGVASGGSPNYVNYLRERFELEHWLREHDFRVDRIYTLAYERLRNRGLKDKVLTAILQRRFHFTPDPRLLSSAYQDIEDSFCRYWLGIMENTLGGREAFAFSLPDVNGVLHEWEDFKNKVVFMDFWYAGCIPCRLYIKNVVVPVMSYYKGDQRVAFVMVSTDSKQSLARVLERGGLGLEDALNLYTDGKRFDHPILRHYGIHSYPFPLLIGRDRTIIAHDERIKTVEGLRYLIDSALE